MKYDFELSLEESSSVGKIIARIDDQARVLEFGPGNGRMTNYLVHEKKCEVSIVEFDEILFEHVMKVANDGYKGDIESFEWCQTFAGKKFDYIVFADVLEHLGNPEEVLRRAKEFLMPKGEILITFPNVAHNSVLIKLFNNELPWAEFGLLDKTHKHFYTENGFHQAFENVGLYIKEQDYTYAQVGQNEIDAEYTDLPVEMQYDMKVRPFGEVYQYFYSLVLEPVEKAEIKIPRNSNHVHELNITYVYEESLEHERVLMNNFDGENKVLKREIASRVKQIKVALPSSPLIMEFDVNLNQQAIKNFTSNAIWRRGNRYVFNGNDPHFFIDVEHLQGETITLTFDILHVGAFSENETALLMSIHNRNEEINSLRTEVLALSRKHEEQKELMTRRYNQLINSSAWQRHRKGSYIKESIKQLLTKSSVDETMHYNIESIDYDPDRHLTIIKGWGYGKKDLRPLKYGVRYDEGIFYNLTRQIRADVNEMFDLNPEYQYGFVLELADYHASDYVSMYIKTYSGDVHYQMLNIRKFTHTQFKTRLRRLLSVIKHEGIKEAWTRYRHRQHQQDAYESWIATNEQFDEEEIKVEILNWQIKPKISVVVPVYNVEEKWLRTCVNSLQNQFYDNWELCLADDCSTKAYIRPLLQQLSEEDERIKIIFREENGHISEATNSAIGIATGEYVGFMDNDDELAPHALYEVVKALNEQPDIDFMYSDEDKVNINGVRFDPFFKPNWNEELLLAHNYITHFVVIKRELLNRVGGLRNEYNGSQDYDFVLRATEQASKIHHIPKILYHWRTVETSVAFDPQSKEYAYVAGERALAAALKRRNLRGDVKMTKNYGLYKIDYQLTRQPKVNIIITGDETRAHQTITEVISKTGYSNYDIHLIGDKVTYMDQEKVKIIKTDDLQAYAATLDGEYLLFLEAGRLPSHRRWLDEMVNYAYREEVSVVGSKMITPENIVLNTGIVCQRPSSIHFLQEGLSNQSMGYYFRNTLPRYVDTLTAECLMVNRQDYLTLQPLLLVEDVVVRGLDICYGVQVELSKKVAWQPYTEIINVLGENPELTTKAMTKLEEKWGARVYQNPYENPNVLEER
ncbi:glycosyltransferase [Vagococcus lutrae]|uniref:glycosyltransferase n=1 Tax=Vagococcus lutrae TaxID=81947 RepID=UPI0028901899|nr:glycosyltransferase [Vagococcus lutrae]MDT2823874.1 glycosyltransferase [Vagococcus lutrae]